MNRLVELTVKSCQPYAKGWQVNAWVDGVESEATFYGATKVEAKAQALRMIERDGRLPHDPYKGA